MTRTVSAAEAKNRFAALLEAASQGDEMIITRYGKPEVALISVADYRDLQKYRQAQEEADALQRLDEIEKEIAERNQDLSEEESIAMAVQLSRELFQDFITRERRNTDTTGRRSA